MAIFIYKAVDRGGNVIRNRVEEVNKFTLLKKLKQNRYLPISVTQLNAKKLGQNIKKQKRNIETSDSILKSVRRQEAVRRETQGQSFINKVKSIASIGAKVSQRDIVTFTQNLYLLKKANFNNIHALSTIIETTENESLKGIIEDILLGVESGDNMYTTMEYYGGVFNPIYINMIKVGELSRVTYKSIRAGCAVSGRNSCNVKKVKVNFNTEFSAVCSFTFTACSWNNGCCACNTECVQSNGDNRPAACNNTLV